MLIAARTVKIGRPRGVVQAQFADVAHHERSPVHRNTRFTVAEESGSHCHYEQVTRQWPITIRQRFHLDRSDPAHQVNTVTSGPFQAGTLTFDIEADGPESTVVTATLRSSRNLPRLAAPMLRAVLGRNLAKALDEDKHDLESYAYQA